MFRGIQEQIHRKLIAEKKTLSFAESCSGGLLAYQFVQLPDCSLYFLGSIVAYSNEAKKSLLGVADSSLVQFGAVSEQVACEMARGALRQFHSDMSLAITGIAGPGGGTSKKPAGTVCIALATQGRPPWAQTLFWKGERQDIISKAVHASLACLWEYLQV